MTQTARLIDDATARAADPFVGPGSGVTTPALAAQVPDLGLDEIASSTFRADLGSFRHETQYTRLFRS